MPGSMMELRENAYNLQYLVGDRIDFLFNEGQLNLSGIVIKSTLTAVWSILAKILGLLEMKLIYIIRRLL